MGCFDKNVKYQISDETRIKMRIAQLGRKHSEETKKKISAANKGTPPSKACLDALRNRIVSESTKKKISLALKGRRHSEESKKKMSESSKGKIHSEKTRAKISQATMGRTITKEHRKKISKVKTGKKLPVPTRNKMSEILKERYAKGWQHPMQKQHLTKQEVESALKIHKSQKKAAAQFGLSQMTFSRLKRQFEIDHDGKDYNKETRGHGGTYKGRYMRSSWEIAFAKALDKLKLRWEYEPKWFSVLDGRRYRPDFYLKDLECYVEVKGHWYPEAKKKFASFLQNYPETHIITIEEKIWQLPSKDFMNLLSTKIELHKLTKVSLSKN